MAMRPGLVLRVLKLWSTSYTMIWFSAIHLFGIKADWAGEIILSSKGLIFSTRSFEIILYTTLQRLISLKWLTEVGFEIFGISTIREALTSLSIEPTPWVCIGNNKVNMKNNASTQKKKLHNFCHNFQSEIVSVHI